MIYFTSLSFVNANQLGRHGRLWIHLSQWRTSPASQHYRCVGVCLCVNGMGGEYKCAHMTPHVCVLSGNWLDFFFFQQCRSSILISLLLATPSTLWLLRRQLRERHIYVWGVCACERECARVMLLVTQRCSSGCPSHHPLIVSPIDHRYALGVWRQICCKMRELVWGLVKCTLKFAFVENVHTSVSWLDLRAWKKSKITCWNLQLYKIFLLSEPITKQQPRGKAASLGRCYVIKVSVMAHQARLICSLRKKMSN